MHAPNRLQLLLRIGVTQSGGDHKFWALKGCLHGKCKRRLKKNVPLMAENCWKRAATRTALPPLTSCKIQRCAARSRTHRSPPQPLGRSGTTAQTRGTGRSRWRTLQRQCQPIRVSMEPIKMREAKSSTAECRMRNAMTYPPRMLPPCAPHGVGP